LEIIAARHYGPDALLIGQQIAQMRQNCTDKQSNRETKNKEKQQFAD